jgi:hypothetical protein
MIVLVSRGRADRALPPSGLAKIFGDYASVKRAALSRQVSPSWRLPHFAPDSEALLLPISCTSSQLRLSVGHVPNRVPAGDTRPTRSASP